MSKSETQPCHCHPKTGYNPMERGARCWECPLGPNPEAQLIPDLLLGEDDKTPREEWRPVGSQGVGRETVVLGEIPGREEDRSGAPLDGASGHFLNETLAMVDSHRREVAVANVLECAGPGSSSGGMERVRARWLAANKPIREENAKRKKENKKRREEAKKRKEAGEAVEIELLSMLPEIPAPWDCCRPRLLKDLSESKNVVLMGTSALRAVLGGTDEGKGATGVDGGGLSVSTKRGAVGEVTLEGDSGPFTLRYGTTYHPSYVLRKSGWRKAAGRKTTQVERDYQADMARFFRFFKGRMNWVDSELLFHPKLDESIAFLDSIIAAGDAVPEGAPQETWPVVFGDTETTAKQGLLARMRCISLGRERASRGVARCSCDVHWDSRIDEHRREWIRKDKRFKAGKCSSCGRAVTRDDVLARLEDGERPAATFKTDFEAILLFTPFSAPWLHDEAGWEALKWRLERILTHPRIIKIGHHFSGYDRLILEDSPWRSWRVVDTGEEIQSGSGKKRLGKWERREGDNREAKGTWLSCTVFPVMDSLLDTRYMRPDGDKGLGDIGPLLSDVGHFKEDHANNKIALTKNLFELGVYCAGADVTVNFRIWKELRRRAADHGAYAPWNPEIVTLLERADETPYETDHRTMAMGLGMHRIGFYVDQDRVRLFQEVLTRQGRQHLARFSEFAQRYGMKIDLEPDEPAKESAEKVEAVQGDFGAADGDGYDGLNVRSATALCELFYDRIGLIKPDFLKDDEFKSKTGNRTVADPILRAFLCDPRTPEDVKQGISELRLAKRKLFTLANNFLLPLTRPLADMRDGRPKGLLWPDGCIRSNINVSSNEVWRLAASNPNTGQVGSRKGGIVVDMTKLHELVKEGDEVTLGWLRGEIGRLMTEKDGKARSYLKSMFRAYPGYMLTGGDADQLHLRVIANLYRIPILLDAFLNGEDPHTRLAEVLFGASFRNGWGSDKYNPKKKPKKGTLAFLMREVAKTFRYAVIYWGSVDTAFRVIIGSENELGLLTNTFLRKEGYRQENGEWMAGVRDMYNAWRKAEPQWEPAFWVKEKYAHQKHGGRVKHPFSQVTSQDMDESDRSLIVNRPVLFGETTYARIAERRMMKAFPFGGEGAARDVEFGGLPGLRLGQYGVYNPGEILREGFCGQTHDWFCASIKDGRGSKGTTADGVDRWSQEVLEKTTDALTVRIPGHEVAYTCEAGLSEYMHEV